MAEIDNEKVWHGNPDASQYLPLDQHRHFALIVTDGEVGGVQQINLESLDALEIWELGPYVVEIPEELKGKVIGGWYYQDGKFVPASERKLN